MASGRPDYFRGVDITYQTLGEIINRPKYGGSNYDEGGITVAADGITDLLTVAGKGMIYGGVLLIDHGASVARGKVQLVIDGDLMSGMGFDYLNSHSIIVPRVYPVYLLKFDDVNFVYAVGISHGITFETSFVMRFAEADSQTPSPDYKLIYALV